MIKNLSSMVSFSMIAVVSTFLFQTVATHILNINDYGVLAKWLTDIGYLGIFFVLGLDSSLLYFAKKGESTQENMTKNFLVYSTVLALSLSIIFLLPIDKTYYTTLSISIFFFAVIGMVRAHFQFLGKFKTYNILLIVRPLIILLAFSLLNLKNEFISYGYAMIVYSLMSLIAGVIIFLFYIKNNNFLFNKKKIFELGYYTYGLKSILNKVLSLSLYASTVYCITYLLNYEIVAYFFIASSISKMVWVVPDSAGNLLYPNFLKIKNKKDDAIALKEMFFYAQIVFFINILSIICFALIGHFILQFLYEESYSINYIPILILLFGNQGMVYYKLISRYLASKNNWKPLYLALSLGIITNVVSNFLLLPSYGLVGAAISTTLSFWACGLSLSFFVKKSFWEFLNLENFFKKLDLKAKLNSLG